MRHNKGRAFAPKEKRANAKRTNLLNSKGSIRLKRKEMSAVGSMSSNFNSVCEKMLGRVTPSSKERGQILQLAEKLRRKVQKSAENAHLDIEVRVEGSVAKNTWLNKEPDIDIFMRLPATMSKEEFGKTGLEIAKEAMKGHRQIERFAEHPYLEAFVDSVRVNIVPCYKVEKGEWKSATDRTPFHTDYVKPLLNEKLCGEIRLLKKFMKGIGVYGSEIKVGGFSGYLCELLTLHYSSFGKVLEAFSKWKGKTAVDYENYYRGREKEVGKLFEELLVIVDPVDKRRNVAAAVRRERLYEFVAASREFIGKPHEDYFYPKETKPLTAEQFAKSLATRGSMLLFLKVNGVKAVPDILWGQLYRLQRSLRTLFRQNDFYILCSGVWSDETNLSIIAYELERQVISSFRKHLGPPIEKRAECESFLQKHLSSLQTVSGPHIEDGRWVVETKRRYTDVVKLVEDKLNGRDMQHLVLPDLIAKSARKDLEVLVNEECLGLYSSNLEFAKFLTEFLDGRPRWLR
jgi:tRNA nucleotidyltransferase (CCA-adding enzyme)